MNCTFTISALYEIKLNLEKKQNTIKRTKADFQLEIQTTSTSLDPLDIFFVQPEKLHFLIIFKLAGGFICENA